MMRYEEVTKFITKHVSELNAAEAMKLDIKDVIVPIGLPCGCVENYTLMSLTSEINFRCPRPQHHRDYTPRTILDHGKVDRYLLSKQNIRYRDGSRSKVYQDYDLQQQIRERDGDDKWPEGTIYRLDFVPSTIVRKHKKTRKQSLKLMKTIILNLFEKLEKEERERTLKEMGLEDIPTPEVKE